MQFSRGAAQHQKVFAMKANTSLKVTLELDFSNETVRDWSVVAWGDQGSITATHADPELKSDSLPFIERRERQEETDQNDQNDEKEGED